MVCSYYCLFAWLDFSLDITASTIVSIGHEIFCIPQLSLQVFYQLIIVFCKGWWEISFILRRTFRFECAGWCFVVSCIGFHDFGKDIMFYNCVEIRHSWKNVRKYSASFSHGIGVGNVDIFQKFRWRKWSFMIDCDFLEAFVGLVSLLKTQECCFMSPMNNLWPNVPIGLSQSILKRKSPLETFEASILDRLYRIFTPLTGEPRTVCLFLTISSST